MTRLARRASSLFLLAAAAAFIAPPTARAQVASTQPDVATEARVYDVRDLIEGVRPYSAPRSLIPPTEISVSRDGGTGIFASGGGGGGGSPGMAGGMPFAPGGPMMGPGPAGPGRPVGEVGAAPSRPPGPADNVIALLEDAVDPSSWRDNGGKVGTVRELAGQLIIRQSAANHRAIADILTQLRETNARTVTVRADWVALDVSQLDAVTRPTPQPNGNAVAFLRADLTAINKLDPKTTLHYRAQTTCLDRQTVRIGSGRARTVVTDLTPVIGNDAAAYQPTAPIVQAGATIELTPRLAPDRTSAIIDVASVVSDWNSFQPAPPAPATTRPTNATPPGGVDRVQLLAQHLRTTVVVPVGEAVVVGGMTLDPSTTGGDARQIYLILEVVGTQTKQ
jgi:hypothetical protein